MDPRRHGRPPVIFQQLFPLCSCTAADRTLQITLIVPTAVCDSPEGSGARCRGRMQTPCGGAPYIYHYGYRQRSSGTDPQSRRCVAAASRPENHALFCCQTCAVRRAAWGVWRHPLARTRITTVARESLSDPQIPFIFH